ncbi:MAG TPA: sulfatase [Fimbriiglobus sp.]|nr:sulfatase [Fimbriiglobus sp.]
MRTRLLIVALAALGCVSRLTAADRPNVFFAIADDWGYPHAGAYGDPAAKTPTFDRIVREGVLFTHAFVSSPSCTPSRSALLTGQFHWRLEESANLWSTLQTKFQTYPELLRDAGYAIGHSRKAWGPGQLPPGGRKQNPAGPTFKDFGTFLKARPKGTPFCFWFGSPDPHRPYDWQSGRKSGIDPAKVRLPGCFPDHETVRDDVADYLFEVQRFDRELGEALTLLKETGELDNTIVVITGDHGMPFPRGKSNLYDLGCRVPLAVRWGAKVKGGRTVDDFVSLTDLAPTFLDAAGVKVPDDMTGSSLTGVLTSGKSGRVDPARDHVLYGKERHVPSQEKGNLSGYPGRAIRTADYLYIRNFKPDLWPNGIPDASKAQIANSFADTDNGPTKTFLIEHKDDPAVKRYYDLAFAKRPGEELYDLRKDPDQLTNVADRPEYAKTQGELREKLMAELKATKDPRVLGEADRFDRYPYYGGSQKPPKKGQ